MRNEQELNVDVAHRATNAADRTRANRRLQEAFDAPRVQREANEPWWRRWFKWETLTVAGRNIEKGWVVPEKLGVALIVLILGAAGSLYWRVTDAVSQLAKSQAADTQQLHILLTRLDERSIQDDKHRREEKQEIQQQIEGLKSHQAAIESVMNKQIAELKARR